MDFYAHSTDRLDKSDWQALPSHLIATGEGAANRAKKIQVTKENTTLIDGAGETGGIRN